MKQPRSFRYQEVKRLKKSFTISDYKYHHLTQHTKGNVCFIYMTLWDIKAIENEENFDIFHLSNLLIIFCITEFR